MMQLQYLPAVNYLPITACPEDLYERLLINGTMALRLMFWNIHKTHEFQLSLMLQQP